MIKLILCEGKSDAVLLGYYLEKTIGWRFTKNIPIELSFKINEEKGQSLNWYCKGAEYLVICTVGGKSNFGRFYKEYIEQEIITNMLFSKIAIVVDRDDDTNTKIAEEIGSELKPIISNVCVGLWSNNYYNNFYGVSNELEFLLVVVPHNENGALEHLLLRSIEEIEEGEIIVQGSVNFVDDVSTRLTKYLTRNRIKLKAYLGVTLAVLSPEKTFSVLDEVIKTVKWEESNVISEVFGELRNI